MLLVVVRLRVIILSLVADPTCSTRMTTLLNERITSSFKARLIEAHLGLDVVSAQGRQLASESHLSKSDYKEPMQTKAIRSAIFPLVYPRRHFMVL